MRTEACGTADRSKMGCWRGWPGTAYVALTWRSFELVSFSNGGASVSFHSTSMYFTTRHEGSNS